MQTIKYNTMKEQEQPSPIIVVEQIKALDSLYTELKFTPNDYKLSDEEKELTKIIVSKLTALVNSIKVNN